MSEENINNEPVLSEEIQQQENNETEVIENQEKSNETKEEVAFEKPSSEDIIKSTQEKAGKAIAAQRKLLNEQIKRLEQENAQLKQLKMQGQGGEPDDLSRKIYDPKTGMVYSFDSENPVEAALAGQVWREQQAEKKSQEVSHQNLLKETAEKVMLGHTQFDDYDNALQTFRAMGNDTIAYSLIATDEPAKIVHYLGNNVQEIERLSHLSPHQIQKEIVKLEIALQDQKKLVTKAKTPIDHLGETKNKFKPPEAQTYEEREAFWKNQINPETRE